MPSFSRTLKSNFILFVTFTLFYMSCSDKKEVNGNSSPGYFSVNVENITDKTAKLVWNKSVDPDGDSVFYSIYIKEELLANEIKNNYYELGGLDPYSEYKGKIEAIDKQSNPRTSVFSFITKSDVPVIETHKVSDFTIYNVTTGCSLIDTGMSEIYEIGIIVGYDSLITVDNYLTKNKYNVDFEERVYKLQIRSFLPETNYYIKSYAINQQGIGYGNVIKFTTLEENVYNGHAILTTQDEIDDFGKNNYTTINGSLEIRGDKIKDLSPLSTIAKVNSSFIIENTKLLKNLKGLETLTGTGLLLGGGFDIHRNSGLESLEGLEGLESTVGETQITDNYNLSSLKGLKNLKYINGGSLAISNNDKLESLDGLDSLRMIGDDLIISDNEILTNLSGIQNISSSVDYLYISKNNSLLSLDGLEQIKKINSFHLKSNPRIENLEALGNVNEINAIIIEINSSLKSINTFYNINELENLIITNNDLLENFEGLNNLQKIKSSLEIIRNNSLLNIDALSNLTQTRNLVIEENEKLNSIDGLRNIKKIADSNDDGKVTITVNNSLTELCNFSQLTFVNGYIQIRQNAILDNFCGLKYFLESGTHIGDIGISGNLSNPTVEQIISDCQ